VFYTVPAEDLEKPVPIPVNPAAGDDTVERIKGLIENEQSKFFTGAGQPIQNSQGKSIYTSLKI
jgi:hypothetical protein